MYFFNNHASRLTNWPINQTPALFLFTPRRTKTLTIRKKHDERENQNGNKLPPIIEPSSLPNQLPWKHVSKPKTSIQP